MSTSKGLYRANGSRNVRQTQSRSYGRPKTRSPFPSNCFCVKRQPRIICLRKNTIASLGSPAQKVTIKKGLGIVPQRQARRNFDAYDQPYNCGSMVKDSDKYSRDYGYQQLKNTESLDIDSSYNLTFYKPNQDSVEKPARRLESGLLLKRELRGVIQINSAPGNAARRPEL